MAKEKKPLKKRLASIALTAVTFLLCMCFGVMLGIFATQVDGGNDFVGFLYVFGGLVMLFLCVFLHIIIHEAGHLVGGLLTGYRFVSFNIMTFVWRKGKDGKLHLGRLQIAGAGGQCLMAPPDYNEGRFPYTLYNLGGAAMNLLAALVCGILLCFVPVQGAPVLYLFLLCMVCAGVLTGVTNGVPLPVAAIQNDGTNQLCIRKDENARRAFWVQMAIAANVNQGKRLRDMPEEWFVPFPEEAMKNPIVSAIAVFKANRLMETLDFEAAEADIRALLARKEGILPLYRTSLLCDGATCELIAGRPADLTEALGEKECQQIIKGMKNHPSILRTQYALALLKDKDPKKAEKSLAEFEAAAPKYPYAQDIDTERKLLLAVQNAALNGGITA